MHWRRRMGTGLDRAERWCQGSPPGWQTSAVERVRWRRVDRQPSNKTRTRARARTRTWQGEIRPASPDLDHPPPSLVPISSVVAAACGHAVCFVQGSLGSRSV
ncbi:hypothetical protein ANO11243_032700 [Dothideomycetidae sp. 11243]|nr:hypothetical protein ANO11243_032700 [fungal sp. No.11243]